MEYKTIKVDIKDNIGFLQIYRPEANNTINEIFIKECHKFLDLYEEKMNILVLEGLPEVFCFGADFQDIHKKMSKGEVFEPKPEALYDLWLRFTTGSYIIISHVRGKVNAGGIGFVSASDIVIADATAQFSLSELLFGVLPAAVFPFLIRRIGVQKANYFTLMTQPISSQVALDWGLVDVCNENSKLLLRKHLLRLKPLSKKAILRHKSYVSKLYNGLYNSKELAIEANKEVFSDYENLKGIYRYIDEGKFPWEK